MKQPISRRALAHERLREAIAEFMEGKDFAAKVADFHGQIRALGITGVHGTHHTLNRWLDGRGTPPEYWLDAAAGILGVNPRWLKDGQGVQVLGSEPLESEAAEDAPGSAAAPPKGEGKGEGPEAREKGSQKPPKGDPDDLPGPEPRLPPGEDPGEPPIEDPPNILEMNSVDAQKAINSTSDLRVIDALEEMEKGNPTYKDGRTTVLDAIGIRRRELQG